jgi:Protein of unknown function (DUF3096)
MQVPVEPVFTLIMGILILLVPRLLNYFVAVYLIIIGLLGQPFQGIGRIRFSWPGFSQWRRGHRFCMPFVALVSSWDRADVSGNVAG